MILEKILVETARAVAAARRMVAPAVVERAAARTPAPRGFARALCGDRLACIAEIKRRSPSAGWIRRDADAATIARAYEENGAAALSVLTDGPFFGGGLDDLTRARSAVGLPILRKDFIIDPYQVAEARACGADAVLLIVAALGDERLGTLLAETVRLGMDALVETHDAGEILRALSAGAHVIGVNHRNLATFEVDVSLAARLEPLVPTSCVMVAESGIRAPADVERMRAAGVDAILVGETLMRAPDCGAALRALLAPPA